MDNEKEVKTTVFMMTPDVALEFFERVSKLKEDTIEARNQILVDLAKEDRLSAVYQTERTPDQVAEDYKQSYGNVLDLRRKDDDIRMD